MKARQLAFPEMRKTERVWLGVKGRKRQQQQSISETQKEIRICLATQERKHAASLCYRFKLLPCRALGGERRPSGCKADSEEREHSTLHARHCFGLAQMKQSERKSKRKREQASTSNGECLRTNSQFNISEYSFCYFFSVPRESPYERRKPPRQVLSA